MLALVRTFASEPKIVVVDEASLGLAPIIVDQIFKTLAEIASTGVSVLLVEQYVTRALALADNRVLGQPGGSGVCRRGRRARRCRDFELLRH